LPLSFFIYDGSSISNKSQLNVSTFYFIHNCYKRGWNGIIIPLNSNKNGRLETKKEITPKRIFTTSLTLLLIVFAFTMSSPSSFFQFVKPSMAITDNDVSTGFMISKNLFDNNAGHISGWDPNGAQTGFRISDGDISRATDDEIYVSSTSSDGCQTTMSLVPTSQMFVECDSPPAENDVLNYIITKLPSRVISSSSDSSPSPSPTTSTFPFALIG
jgi:hypothetical protein